MPFARWSNSSRLRAGEAAPGQPASPPGAAKAREHGGSASLPSGAVVLDFSVNINPFGPSSAVIEAVRAAPANVYPDPTGRKAREALARATGCQPNQVVLGNGAAELLWTLAGALLSAGDSALVVAPAFSEFAAAARHRGARLHEWRAQPEARFKVDLVEVAEAIARSGARAVYLCSPGNPTGAHVPITGIAALAEQFPDVAIVLDQAFLSLSGHHADAGAPVPDNLIRVRSLTKDHGIPGIRLGYLLTTAAWAAAIELARPPWTTSTAAQAAAIACCDAESFVAESRERLLPLRVALESRLAGLGLAVAPSCTVFCVARVGDSAGLKERLLAGHGILVRDCTSFGLPDWVRLAARPEPDQERLIAALQQEIAR